MRENNVGICWHSNCSRSFLFSVTLRLCGDFAFFSTLLKELMKNSWCAVNYKYFTPNGAD